MTDYTPQSYIVQNVTNISIHVYAILLAHGPCEKMFLLAAFFLFFLNSLLNIFFSVATRLHIYVYFK